MQHMTEKLGSWQISGGKNNGKVQFRLFFPDEANGLLHNIKSIQVVGDFQTQLGHPENWDPVTAPALTKIAHNKGEIWHYKTDFALTKGFYQYKYYVSFNEPTEAPRWISDRENPSRDDV